MRGATQRSWRLLAHRHCVSMPMHVFILTLMSIRSAFIFAVLVMISIGTFYDYFVYLPTLNNLPKSRVSVMSLIVDDSSNPPHLQEPLLGDEANGGALLVEMTKVEYMEQLRTLL